ncbi:ABC transporter permease subunit [bacterium]|nr:ABC transporter permease subunit [candidate division CSSED10-310 bacterium]
MNREWTDFRLIATHDIRDALRSRRLIVWLVLYLCIAIGGTVIFCQVLRVVEKEIARVVAVDTPDKAGAVTDSIQKSENFKGIVNNLIEDDSLANQLLTLPPLVLFFGWFSFTFMPLLVILLCSDIIARDINSRFVRFVLFRTSRAAYASGKAISAAGLLLVALFVSALATMIVGAMRLHDFHAMAVLPHMMLFVVKCWLYSLAFLGIALMASQLRNSPMRAQILALITYLFLIILSPIAAYRTGPGWARLWELGTLISPASNVSGLWMPDPVANLKAGAFCIGLGLFYFTLGFLSFSRKDL